MLVSLEKATEILLKQGYVIIATTDNKLALVPEDKADIKVTSMEAINMMLYVVRQSSPEDTFENQKARLDELLEQARIEAAKPDPVEERAKRYREIRGIG